MGDFCFARTDQSRDPQDLTMAEDETDIAEELLYRQPTNIQDRATERYVFFRKLLGQPAADHQADEFVHRQPGNRIGADILPVPQYGHAVGNIEHLLQAMRDVDDADIERTKVADQPKKPLR